MTYTPTFKPIDGGPTYYGSNGHTFAANRGWDNPSFFPVGAWYGRVISQADANRWHDLSLNTLFRTDQATNLPLCNSNGLSAIVSDDGSGLETPNPGAETVGLLGWDEPASLANAIGNPAGKTPNSIQDGRFWYTNFMWTALPWNLSGDGASLTSILNALVATPNGTKRHLDAISLDSYWFTAGKPRNGDWQYAMQVLYGVTGASTAQMANGARYGDFVDFLRHHRATYDIPLFQFVEVGGPYTYDTTFADYITPPEINWGAWSSIIHGARGLIYFNHTFGGPAAVSDDSLADSYFQTVKPPNTVSIYAQVKATNALIKQMAPAINSPTVTNYVTVTPAGNLDAVTASGGGGIETLAKLQGGHYYVFAATRGPESQANLSATFATADGYSGPVTVVSENRSVMANAGVFTDVFAHGSTVHIYEIPTNAKIVTVSGSATVGSTIHPVTAQLALPA